LSRPTLRSQRTGTPQRLSCRVGTAAWGAAALTAYYALIVVILMNGRVVLAHYAEYLTYEGVAIELAIAAGVAILAGVQARLAAILLTVMFASFTPLVHVPMP